MKIKFLDRLKNNVIIELYKFEFVNCEKED
jgi:hypothetical protein